VVVQKRISDNTLVLAFDTPETPLLYCTTARLLSLSFTNQPVLGSRSILARPRYRAPASPATFETTDSGEAVIRFDAPQRALTPGQICALYDGEILLGAGVFAQIDD
jgi:tRNA-specific 2-thiouridylase